MEGNDKKLTYCEPKVEEIREFLEVDQIGGISYVQTN